MTEHAVASWVHRAVCADAGVPTDWFTPDAGLDLRGRLTRERETEYEARHSAALALCARCPVRDECLADARATGATGIRGGQLIPDGRRLCVVCGRQHGGKHHRICSACQKVRTWARSRELKGTEANVHSG